MRAEENVFQSQLRTFQVQERIAFLISNNDGCVQYELPTNLMQKHRTEGKQLKSKYTFLQRLSESSTQPLLVR